MKRRDFIAALGGAAAWPLAARAQANKIPTIGFLGATTAALQSQWTAAFLQRLRELGWNEGRNINVELRWADGQVQRATEIIGEFVRRKVDVIVTHGSQAVIAAKQATSTIPIIFPVLSDPVGTGIVASLARPGGNLTGLSLLRTDTASKRLELLRDITPGFRRLGIIGNVANPSMVLEISEVRAAAGVLGLEVIASEIRRSEDVVPAFETLKGRAQALYVAAEPVVYVNRVQIATLALDARLLTIFGVREYLEGGGLMSYGPNFPDQFRRSAEIVDKVLRGARPADIPVEQPIKFDLVLNLKIAKALGLTIPEAFLLRADEVIE